MTDTDNFLILRGEYITLTQFMKSMSWVASGSEAHFFILEGQVLVNGQVVTEKRKKLYAGDVVEWNEYRAELRA